jgi:hypothetical protein
MIMSDFRRYSYFTLGANNAYGQPQLSEEPQGTILMSIYITNQSTQDNIRYKDATYVGLTFGNIDDKCVIDYGGEKLKVLYVNPQGRFKQVFMKNI